MRRASTIIAIVMISMGALWTLQGVGIVGGSFMTGQSEWTYIGIATIIVGAILFLAARRSAG